jgi:surface polysaccharide O-acyltransferase-like enzyme
VRSSYADLLRSGAIAAVVFGHWLVTGVEARNGRYVGVDALGVISWSSWVTLGLQVVPVFFLVGGFANSGSWSRHEASGEPWSVWVRARVLRMLGPTCWYAATIATLVVYAQLTGVNRATLQQAGWAVALHLWFVAVYVVVLLCTPALMAAHRRWGLRVAAVMCGAAVLIDATVIGWHWHLIGWGNYLLVWGAFHQVGFAWRDGTLTIRRRPLLLAGSAVVLLISLIWWGPYPVSMVGVPGAHIENASPPSAALLAFGLAQCGLALACEPVATRWLGRHARARARIATTGALTMPVYLWHMVPVVIVIEAGYPHLIGLPAVGSARWWEQRIAWILALTVVLTLLLVALTLIRTATRRWIFASSAASSGEGDDDQRAPGSAALLVFGVALGSVAISQLAVSGFAPHGHLNVAALAMLALSMGCVRFSAHTTPNNTLARRRSQPQSRAE